MNNIKKVLSAWMLVAQPVAVRYAFRNYVGNITLRNTLGIAAFPFRTDTWDDVK